MPEHLIDTHTPFRPLNVMGMASSQQCDKGRTNQDANNVQSYSLRGCLNQALHFMFKTLSLYLSLFVLPAYSTYYYE